MMTHPLRSLRRTPVFAAAAALTLALGIGSVAAAFAIAYGVLLDPLPFGHPDRLVSVGLQSTELRRIQQPAAIYHTYRRFARRIPDIGFYRTGNANLVMSDGGADPLRVTATWVTASTIPLLQVAPILGRPFTDDEDRTGGPEAAVISESVWRTLFQASPDVVGKTLIVNGVPRAIVGVMPPQFMFPTAETKVWLPARLDRDATAMGDFAYSGVARLATGAAPEEAQRELASLLPRLAELFPRLGSGSATTAWLEQTRPTPVVVSLRDEVTRGIARTLWMLAAAAGLVLFVALANVTNLMMIRADARQLELAVREALGASRLRTATYFLGESMVLTAFAGAAALLASWAAVRALVAFGPADVPRLAELHVGASTVAFVVAISVIAALICTLVPTIRIRRATLSISLRDGGRGETAGRVRQRLRATMAAAQIAVALVALAGSALLLRTFQRLGQERPGFDATNVLTVWTQLPFARYGDSASVAFYARLTESVARLPGVAAVGVTSRLPLGDGEAPQLSFRRDDGHTLSLPIVAVDSGYFASMKIGVFAGSGFQRLGLQRAGDIVLSRRAVQVFLRDTAPAAAIGRRVSLAAGGPTYTVVGVVGDVRDQELGTPPSPTVYMPQVVPIDGVAELRTRRTMALVVRSHRPPENIVAPIRKIVHDLDPTVPIFNVETMHDIVRASTARLSLTLALMSAAAVITLLLGAIGLYGVMTYLVALRTREFGIRVAIGANPTQLARSVALGGMKLLAIGIAGGFILYAVAAPFLRAFLYGVTPTDPITLVGVTAVLVTTAFFASWLPARRASRVDPTVALRAE
jgi:putative ABC transport system permease protein